jgi:hypothetical protein
MPLLKGADVGALQTLVADAFEVGDLEQLLRVSLETTLADAVAVGQPRPAVVFDLIVWLEHRNRTPEFLRAVRAARPQVVPLVALCDRLLAPPAGAAAAAAPDPGRLPILLAEFRAVFEERRKWFDCLNAYKALHDVLHKLQDQQVALFLAVQRFRDAPADPLELTRIAEKLDDELVATAQEALPRTEDPAEEGEWVGAFVRAVRDLADALAPPKPDVVDNAAAVLRTVYNQQARLNRELVRCARRLKPDDLVQRMEQILALLGAKAAALRTYLTTFSALCVRLTALGIDHNTCQDLDPYLAAAPAAGVTRDRVAEWPKVQAGLLRIAARRPADPMAARLVKYAAAFAAATDPPVATAQFTLLRDQFGRLFNKTDEDLLTVTDNLVRTADLLGTELKGIA